MRSVFLCGPSSCGKTTLANDVLRQAMTTNHDEIAVHLVVEVARTLIRDKNISIETLESWFRVDTPESKESFIAFQRDVFLQTYQQCVQERSRGHFFICDRGIDPLAYISQRVPDALPTFEIDPVLQKLCTDFFQNELDVLVVVVMPLVDVPNEVDGVRQLDPDCGYGFARHLCEVLVRKNVPFRVLHVQDRQQRAKRIVEWMMNTSSTTKLDSLLSTRVYETEPPLVFVSQYNYDQDLFKQKNRPVVTITRVDPSNTDLLQYSVSFPTQSHKFSRIESTLEPHEDLITVSFDRRLKGNVIKKFLWNGVSVAGTTYWFLGCSSSGLRAKKCVLVRGNQLVVNSIEQRCGENIFRNATVSKATSRLALLFTTGSTDSSVTPAISIDIDDVRTADKEYLFTDGCGYINRNGAKSLQRLLKVPHLPSIFQIRWQGCKGTLQILPDSESKAWSSPRGSMSDVQLVQHRTKESKHFEKCSFIAIRPSMKKFESKVFPAIVITDNGYSKPFQQGFLNKQFIMILVSVGVKSENFLSLAKSYVRNVRAMTTSLRAALEMSLSEGDIDSALEILEEMKNGSTDCSQLGKGVQARLHEYKRVIKLHWKKEKVQGDGGAKIADKIRLPVQLARNIYGTCDPTSILTEGQCYIRVQLTDFKQPQEIRGNVVVCKSPCYLLGDVRVLSAIGPCDELRHLQECIVFPRQGKRPHCTEIAGSDLDGDQYFVCWDERFIPANMAPAFDYKGGGAPPPRTAPVEVSDRIDYFCQQRPDIVGTLNNLFVAWASRTENGCRHPKCDEIGRLFSRAVDAPKTGEVIKIPQYLYSVREEAAQCTCGVWCEIENLLNSEMSSTEDNSVDEELEDFLFSLLEDQGGLCRISTVQRLELLSSYVYDIGPDVALLQDYSNLSAEQQFRASCVRQRQSDHAILTENQIHNAVLSSRCLSDATIDFTGLRQQNWKLCFRKSIYPEGETDIFSTVMSDVQGVLSRHKRVLLIFGLPKRMSILFFFPHEVNSSTEEIRQFKAFFSSPTFRQKHFSMRTLQEDFAIEFDPGKRIQIFPIQQKGGRGSTANTFVWVGCSGPKKERGHKQKGNNATAIVEQQRLRVSIDLTRFSVPVRGPVAHPLITKEPVTNVEMYVDTGGEVFRFGVYDVLGDGVEELDLVAEDPGKVLRMSQQSNEEYQKHLARIRESTASSMKEVCECLRNMDAAGWLYPVFLTEFKKGVNVSYDTEYPSLTTLDKPKSKKKTKETTPSNPSDVESLLTQYVQMISDRETFPPKLDSENFLSALESGVKLASYLTYLRLCPSATLVIDKIITAATSSGVVTTIPLEKRLEFMHDHITDLLGLVDVDTQQLSRAVSIMLTTVFTNEEEMYVSRLASIAFLEFATEFLEIIKEQDNASVFSPPSVYDQYQTNCSKDSVILTFPLSRQSKKAPKCGAGDDILVSLLQEGGDAKDMSVWRHRVCYGRVESITGGAVNVKVDKRMNVTDVTLVHSNILQTARDQQCGNFALIPLGNVTLLRRSLRALMHLVPLLGSDTVARFLVNQSDDRDVCGDDMNIADLFPTADGCVDALVNQLMRRKVSVVQGPPGTGKTFLSAALVTSLLGHTTTHAILVCAETNYAVDNLTRKIREALKGTQWESENIILRFSRNEQVAKDLFDVTIPGKLERRRREGFECNAKHVTSDFRHKFARQEIAKTRILCCTAVSVGDDMISNNMKRPFDFIIMDEATQVRESAVWIALLSGKEHKRVPQVVFIGDHKQLGAFSRLVCNTTGKREETMFHKLVQNSALKRAGGMCTLKVQRRMHEALMEFPSKHFYNGELQCGVDPRTCTLQFEWPDLARPLAFCHVTGKERKSPTHSGSYFNDAEINCVEMLLQRLETSGVEMRTKVVVLSFYNGQVSALNDRIGKLCEVCTCDAFQGRETDFVIFSFVRTEHISEFMSDPGRVNVLLTRGKWGLTVVGEEKCMKTSPIWNEWIQQAPRFTKFW